MIQSIIDIRSLKKDLYTALMKKGFVNLSDTEKQILINLSLDKDILLMLRNGHVFEIKSLNNIKEKRK